MNAREHPSWLTFPIKLPQFVLHMPRLVINTTMLASFEKVDYAYSFPSIGNG
jgi:hypothetical protein